MNMKIRTWFSPENKKFAFLAIAIIAAIILAVLYTNSKGQFKTKGTPELTKALVDTVNVHRADMIRKISLVGQTVPAAQIDIVAKYSGRITQVNAELGQQVSGGQILIVQDIGDIDLAIYQADATRQQAAADAAEAAATFDANYNKALVDYQRNLASYQRYQALYETGAISRESLDTAEQQMLNAKSTLNSFTNQIENRSVPAAVEAKQAAILKAERNVDALNKQRDDLLLRAPRDGMIGFRQVEVGAFVQPGQKLLSVVDNSSIYVDCQVSEQDVAPIQIGQQINVQLDSLGRTYKGQIIYISPASDAKTQSFTIRLALTDPDNLVRSGLFARAIIEVVQRPQTLFIPKEALLEKNGEYSIFVINSLNQVEQRKVAVGLRNDKEVEIISGMFEGDQVAISNLARLKPGMKVTPHVISEQNALNPQDRG